MKAKNECKDVCGCKKISCQMEGKQEKLGAPRTPKNVQKHPVLQD